MVPTTDARTARYCWESWFTSQSFRDLAALFVLLSLADLIATLHLLPAGIQEGNLLAAGWLYAYGTLGFVFYKFAMVSVVLGAMWLVQRSRPELALRVLWGAVVLMGVIALIHLAIMAGLTAG